MSDGRRFAILAVCTANICRSPIMESLLRNALDPLRFEVASAGVRGWDGEPIDEMAGRELLRLGGTVDGFRSRPIDAHLVAAADLVLTATRAHRSDVLMIEPTALHRTFTLVEFAALCADAGASAHAGGLVAEAARRRGVVTGDLDVGDPYRRTALIHRRSADQIATAVRVVADRLGSSVLA